MAPQREPGLGQDDSFAVDRRGLLWEHRHAFALESAPLAMKRTRLTAICGVCLGAAACGLILSARADDGYAQARLGKAVFVAGGALSVHEPVAGDLFVAGGSVDVDAAVGGNALAGAGKLRLSGDVGDAIYAAAGHLLVNGKVGRDVRAAGGQVEFGPQADVLGNVAVAGGQLRLLGAVHGDVQAAGGRLLLNGRVGGDVNAATGQVELGPEARIAGKLRLRGGSVQRDAAAQVAGGVETWPSGWGHEEPSPAPHSALAAGTLIGWFGTLSLVLLAALLLAAGPGFQARVARTLQQRPLLSVLLGIAWLVCAPVAVLLLILTVVGIPLALIGAALYIVLLPLAYVSAAIALGDRVLRALRTAALPTWGWRAAAAGVVLVVLSQATRVPWLGAAVVSLALLAGIGALALQVRRQPQAR